MTYNVRKLSFIAGYSRLVQGFSLSGTPPTMVGSFYVGIIEMVQFLLSGSRTVTTQMSFYDLQVRIWQDEPVRATMDHHQDARHREKLKAIEQGPSSMFSASVPPLAVWCCLLLCLPGVAVAGSKAKPAGPVTLPELELTGGRKLLYEGSVNSEREVRIQRRFWGRLLDVVAGEPDYHALIAPYSVVTDSHDRIIVTDPGASGIHIFDFAQHKYKFISRSKDVDGLSSPQCVAVDADDNIYVTDSYSGKIFCFDANGKFRRVIGSIKGEGYFKRATGIAVDSPAQRIYVTDTLRNQIWVLDMQGKCIAEDRRARLKRWTIQLSHRIAAGRPGPARR